MKKIEKNNTVAGQADIIASAIESTADASLVDGGEASTGQFTDLVDAVVKHVQQTGKVVDANAGHSILSKEAYKGISPDIQVTPAPNTGGFGSQAAVPKQQPNQNVRTATDLDLANLDESQIMSMPFLAAADFTLVDSLNLKPKDPAIRFRWVNFKNFVAGNYGRYMALGFEIASVSDVDTDKTPVHDSMINGTKIEWYDIQLMKIHVLKLMALYKRTVVSSLGRIRDYQGAGQAAAETQFNNDIASDPALRAGLNKMRMASKNGEDPIEFYNPNTRS